MLPFSSLLEGRGWGRAYSLLEISGQGLLDLAAHLTLPALLCVAGIFHTNTNTHSPAQQASWKFHEFMDREVKARRAEYLLQVSYTAHE